MNSLNMSDEQITEYRMDRIKSVLKVNGIPLDARTRKAIEQLIPKKDDANPVERHAG